MTKGRTPKPALLKALEGNRGHRKVSFGATPSAGPFEPPFELGPVALAEWNRILAEAFWLTEVDAGALADRCRCYERLQEAEDDIRKHGLATGRRSHRKANPSARFARQYRMAIQKYDTQLGLTSSARERAGGPGLRTQASDIDPLEAALCGPFGFQEIRIWREIRRGKVEYPTNAAERAEWDADQLDRDRRLAAWKASAGIFDDGDGPIPAPGLNAPDEEWHAYNTAKLEQHAKIEAALHRAGLTAETVKQK